MKYPPLPCPATPMSNDPPVFPLKEPLGAGVGEEQAASGRFLRSLLVFFSKKRVTQNRSKIAKFDAREVRICASGPQNWSEISEIMFSKPNYALNMHLVAWDGKFLSDL